MEEAGVDHLVVTGDLTLSAETSEFERAAKLLRRWADAGKLTVVPGNHDVWTAESVKTARFLRMIGPDGRGMRRPAASYPFVALPSPEVAVVALDSCPVRGGAILDRPGRSDRRSSRPAGSWSASTSRRGGPCSSRSTTTSCCPGSGSPPTPSWPGLPLADADKVVRLVSDLRVAGVLHGHRHCAFRVDIPGAAGTHAGPLRRLGDAGSSDEPVRRARGYVYEVDRGGIRSVQPVFATRG